MPHNVMNICTDGSKIGGKVGAAAVIIKDDMTPFFISLSTNYTRDSPIIGQNW